MTFDLITISLFVAMFVVAGVIGRLCYVREQDAKHCRRVGLGLAKHDDRWRKAMKDPKCEEAFLEACAYRRMIDEIYKCKN